ncbi:MAG: deoxyribonuclease IV [Candidatus Margulisbacteria bacterium]|nr:deoxyribonuclease IV [Candidatus Margulisiibacteriota bacterium]
MARLLGSHMSIAGGVEKAIERGQSLGCTAIQIFVKSNRQWASQPFAADEVERFFAARKESGMFVFAHTGYLINLAAAGKDDHQKSMRSMLEEFEKSEALKLPFIVLHPGSHGGAGEAAGIDKVAGSINNLFKVTKGYQVKLALETTAGQGSALGYKFEHFARWFDLVNDAARLGVCVDTCHIYAAGYDIKTPAGYQKTWQEFDELIGYNNLLGFHLNDCKKGLGSHVDRHEHIGQGELGKEAFRLLLNDKNLKNLPMALETPKDPDLKLDKMNLKVLRSLIKD